MCVCVCACACVCVCVWVWVCVHFVCLNVLRTRVLCLWQGHIKVGENEDEEDESKTEFYDLWGQEDNSRRLATQQLPAPKPTLPGLCLCVLVCVCVCVRGCVCDVMVASPPILFVPCPVAHCTKHLWLVSLSPTVTLTHTHTHIHTHAHLHSIPPNIPAGTRVCMCVKTTEHGESYNPPPEFLPSEKRRAQIERVPKSERRKYYVPTKSVASRESERERESVCVCVCECC